MSGPTLEAEQTGLVLWPILAHIPFYLSALNVLQCRPYLRYPAPNSTDDGLCPPSVRPVQRSFARPPLGVFLSVLVGVGMWLYDRGVATCEMVWSFRFPMKGIDADRGCGKIRAGRRRSKVGWLSGTMQPKYTKPSLEVFPLTRSGGRRARVEELKDEAVC